MAKFINQSAVIAALGDKPKDPASQYIWASFRRTIRDFPGIELEEEAPDSSDKTGQLRTNEDKIRDMSTEDLSKFLAFAPSCTELCPDFCTGCAKECKHDAGIDVFREWLTSCEEAEE